MQYFMLQCSPLICVLLQFVQSTYDLSRRKNGQTAKNMKTTIKNTRSFPWTCWPNYFVYRRSGTICKNWKTLMKIAQNQSRNCSNGLFFCKFSFATLSRLAFWLYCRILCGSTSGYPFAKQRVRTGLVFDKSIGIVEAGVKDQEKRRYVIKLRYEGEGQPNLIKGNYIYIYI